MTFDIIRTRLEFNKKNSILLFLLIFSVSYASSTEIRYDEDCSFPPIRVMDSSFDIHGSKDYNYKLVENTHAYYLLNVTIEGNLSTDFVRFRIIPNFTIPCMRSDNPHFLGVFTKITPYRTVNGTVFTELIAEGNFPISEGSKECYASVRICGYNFTNNCHKKVGLTYNTVKKEVTTKTESLTKRQIEIMEKQTNISKRQAEIAEQQKQAMDTSNLMIIVAAIIGAIIGTLGAIYGSKIGSDRAIKGHLKLQKKQLHIEKMGRISEPVCNQLSQTLEENIAEIEKSESSGNPTNHRWRNVKSSYEFKITPKKLRDKLINYFDDKIAKQMERQEKIDEDIGRLLWDIFKDGAKEKGLPTESLEYPEFSLSKNRGKAIEYNHKIRAWLLAKEEIDMDLVFQESPRLKVFYDKIQGSFDSTHEKETVETHNVIIDSILKLQDNLTDDITKELEEYRRNNKKILEESKKLNEKLEEIMNKYGH